MSRPDPDMSAGTPASAATRDSGRGAPDRASVENPTLRIRPTLHRRVKWRAEWAAYLVFEKLIGLVPPSAASRLGACIGAVAGRLSPSRRKTVERNLRIAFGSEKSAEELARLVDEVFRRNGANLIASLCTAGLPASRLDDVVTIENPEALSAIATPGRGAVVLLAHMGNWEVLAQAFPKIARAGNRAGTIYRLLNNPHMDAHVKTMRRKRGLELFEKRVNPLVMASFIREGGVLAILSDQRAEAAGEVVAFFGRLTSCTPLPAIFARRLGVPVIGVSMRTVAHGRWAMKIHTLRDEPTTQNCMNLLEAMMRESPADVFWMQDRWRVNRGDPLLLNGRPPGAEALHACTKMRRVVVWLGQSADPAPPAAIKDYAPDLAWEYSRPENRAISPPGWLPAGALVHVRSTADDVAGIKDELLRIGHSTPQPLDAVLVAPDANPAVLGICRELRIPTMLLAR